METESIWIVDGQELTNTQFGMTPEAFDAHWEDYNKTSEHPATVVEEASGSSFPFVLIAAAGIVAVLLLRSK